MQFGVFYRNSSILNTRHGEIKQIIEQGVTVMAQIRWLHISDLHLQKENTARQEQLPNYIRKLKSVYCDIGYLFISGDIFYGKDKSVCKKAVVEYIHLLANTLDIEYSNICLVPGNHDLTGQN